MYVKNNWRPDMSKELFISEYELSKLYLSDFKSSMPSITEIEESLKEK